MPSPIRSSDKMQSPSARSPDRGQHRSRHGFSHSHRHRHRDSSRERSRSPHRSDRHRSDRRHRREDRDKERERGRDHRERREKEKPAKPVILPFHARELSRRDLETYEPMFAMYLDIQKGHYIEDMKEDEVKGRWKSFIQKWNRGELAEGWYEPATLQKARQNAAEQQTMDRERASPDYARGGQAQSGDVLDPPPAEDDEDEDDDYGPKMPHSGSHRATARSGPAIPNMQDLELRRETAMEDAMVAREDSRDQYRSEIRSHKAEQRHLLDEVAPRAEAGTRERQLEKRREAAAANRSFAEARGASPEAAPEVELMGSGDNDLAALKREKEQNQRKKNEREIRREEILRARAAEREERIQKYREKEQETIGWLQTLAKQRFG